MKPVVHQEVPQMETVKGGRKVVVTFENGDTADVFVAQLKLAQWDDAFKKFDNEMELTAFICGRTKAWLVGSPPDHANALTPESYRGLVHTAREVNETGFFDYATRQQETLMKKMQQMPESLIRAAASKLTASALASPPSPV